MSRKNFLFVIVFWAAFSLAGSRVWAADAVTGTIAYPPGAVLPPGAVVVIEILDEFAGDAPNVIAHTEIPAAGRLPDKFTLNYDPAKIQGNHPYDLAVEVRSGNQQLFASAKKYPVLTQGGGGTAALVLIPVASQPETKPYGPAIEDTYWKLVSLGAAPVVAASSREPHLRLIAFTHTVSGSGGCNILHGGYALNAQQIVFSDIATTRMACPSGSNYDDALSGALQSAGKWRVIGEQLELFDARGTSLASFQGIPPKQPIVK
jgi:uncharacterized lipoprotein YbaY